MRECGCVLLVLIGGWSEDEDEVEVGTEHVLGCIILRRRKNYLKTNTHFYIE